MTTPTTQREADERAQLAEAIHAAAVKVGIIHAGAPVTCPHLIMLCDDLARAAIDQSTRQAAPTTPDSEQQGRHVLELANAALIAAQPRDITTKGWTRHHGAIDAINCALHNPVAATTDQPSAGQVDEQMLFETRLKCDSPSADVTRKANGDYENMITQGLWLGWRLARASLTPTAPADQVDDAMRQRVRDAVAGSLTSLYHCGRVWSAWGYGTMHESDFSPAAEDDDIIENITSAAIDAMATPTAPQAASQQAGAIDALREMVRWFGKYPEFVPSVDRFDEYKAAISTAKSVLASQAPIQSAPLGSAQLSALVDMYRKGGVLEDIFQHAAAIARAPMPDTDKG